MFAGARRFHGRVQRQDIGLEGDALNHVDNIGHLLGAGVDRLHRVDHGRHHLTAALGDARCRLCKAVGFAGALGVLLHHRSQLAHAGRRFLQRRGLLLRALRQIGIASRDPVRGLGNRVGGRLDPRNQVGQHVLHPAEPAEQGTEGTAALGLEFLAEVAGGDRLGDQLGLGQRLLDALGQRMDACHGQQQGGDAQAGHPFGGGGDLSIELGQRGCVPCGGIDGMSRLADGS